MQPAMLASVCGAAEVDDFAILFLLTATKGAGLAKDAG